MVNKLSGTNFRVVDGDTFVCLIRARIAYCDAPELSTKEGKDAKQQLRDLFTNRGSNQVLLSPVVVDDYGRLVCIVEGIDPLSILRKKGSRRRKDTSNDANYSEFE